jgi:23S rRNA (uracil1939-C5)-methyltransferase
VAEVGERAAVEALGARLALDRQQGVQTIEVASPPAAQPQAAVESSLRRHAARASITFPARRALAGPLTPGQSAGVAAPPADRLLDLAIERLTYGADALSHHEGRVVFVPFAAPGDRVRARVVERRRDWVRAEIHELLASGPARTVPRCPVFGHCGGCQWQHITTTAQHAAKSAVVAEQLARLGGLRDADVRPLRAAPEAWRYRARITLVAEGRQLGLRRARSHELVEITDCAIADPALVASLGTARAWAGAVRSAPVRVTLSRAPGGVVLTAILRTPPTPVDVAATERILADDARVRGAILAGPGARHVVGDVHLRVTVEPDLALEVPADAFTQVHPEANLLLVATVLELGEFRRGMRALDLFCGAGNFSLPLARRGVEVTGIERARVAVDAARANAARLGLDAVFVCDAVAPALARLAPDPLDTVVLDPPRAGAAEITGPLAARRIGRLLYVSCDPATLARDARALVGRGYRLGRVQPVDLFPQTYHVETVAEFVLT